MGGRGSVVYTSSQTYQSPLGFDQGSVLSVHFMVQSARIAQIMTGPIPAPERGGGGPTVHAFSSLCQISKRKKNNDVSHRKNTLTIKPPYKQQTVY